MLVCMMALPMPKSENEMYISHSWLSFDGMKLSNRGSNTASVVTATERRTVRLRPILFISIPVGTEKIRNQKNTSEGKKLASVLVKPKSSCILFDTAPTRSTNPIVKKVSMIGSRAILLLLLMMIDIIDYRPSLYTFILLTLAVPPSPYTFILL